MTRGRDRWGQAGAALLGVGATIGVPYWIYTLQSDGDVALWSPVFIGSLALGAIGLILLLGSLRSGQRQSGSAVDGAPSAQKVQGGANSRNYAAGRDINYTRERDE